MNLMLRKQFREKQQKYEELNTVKNFRLSMEELAKSEILYSQKLKIQQFSKKLKKSNFMNPIVENNRRQNDQKL
ncbi:unnamed protein product [Paramecium sonneborni]|uniref:Uncharacterized protein n=1 Tax=Paramecium sonneborni TaxID=65129 RepID=A0A8S1RJR5_9CILI|nr:unnamed protein product [Paramecium sonneborni]